MPDAIRFSPIEEGIAHCDVVMMLCVQRERMVQLRFRIRMTITLAGASPLRAFI
jgi:aspartate carbamoyltransferase catalytic subunit